MKRMKITKDNLEKWLTGLAGSYAVIAPTGGTGDVNFKKINNFSDINLKYSNSKIAPKSCFFPQYEKLISYKISGQGVEVKSHLETDKSILFGARACDVRSLAMLDKVFNNDTYRDPYYFGRRENTVIIGLACNRPGSACFCSSFGITPASAAGSDIFLFDLGDGNYSLEFVTEKGKTLPQPQLAELTAADNARISQIESVRPASTVDVANITKNLDGAFEHEYWDTLSEKCISCNACAFSCPTCHCFDMTEEINKTEGARVRTWDTCMAPLFTLHGSGHNPRDKKKARWRQRLMHKFNYFVHNNGEMACVGCGRCIKKCPVNFDIRQAIEGASKIAGGVK